MATWGPGPFDNDQAMDLLLAYEEKGAVVLTDLMKQWARADTYIDADLAAYTIAAGEIVAACHGVPMRSTPAEGPRGADPATLRNRLIAHKEAVAADAQLLIAVRAHVNPTLMNPLHSELAELWSEEEGEEGTLDFRARLEGLEVRLAEAGE